MIYYFSFIFHILSQGFTHCAQTVHGAVQFYNTINAIRAPLTSHMFVSLQQAVPACYPRYETRCASFCAAARCDCCAGSGLMRFLHASHEAAVAAAARLALATLQLLPLLPLCRPLLAAPLLTAGQRPTTAASAVLLAASCAACWQHPPPCASSSSPLLLGGRLALPKSQAASRRYACCRRGCPASRSS